jgi:ribonuclease PH
VQLTGEGGPFPAARLPQMLEMAQVAIKELTRIQAEVLAPWLSLPW